MQNMLTAAVLISLSWASSGDSAAQQPLDILPVGARVRVVPDELRHYPTLMGQVTAAGACIYIIAELRPATTLGVPLSRVIALHVEVSDGSPRIPSSSTGAWLEVDLDAVMQRQPEECEGQPFTKVTPLKWGI